MRHRMLRSAILSATRTMFADPATMNAVEILADGDINRLVDKLWRSPESLEFGHVCSLGIEYSPRKQAALLLVTGRDMAYWFGLPVECAA